MIATRITVRASLCIICRHIYTNMIYAVHCGTKNMKKIAILISTLFLITAAACATTQEKTEVEKQVDMDYQMAVNYYSANRTPEAIRSLALVLANDPKHAEANYLMGIIRLGREQYEEAEKHFKTALETNPDMLNCKNNLGVTYLHLERYEEAAVIFRDLSKSPLYTSPWLAFVNLGWAYYQMGMTAEAIDETEMAVSLNPDLCLGFNNLGIYYESTGRTERAIENLNEAIKQCANYAEPHMHLGVIYAAQGSDESALVHFKRCAELSPKTDLGKRCSQNARVLR